MSCCILHTALDEGPTPEQEAAMDRVATRFLDRWPALRSATVDERRQAFRQAMCEEGFEEVTANDLREWLK